MNFVTSKNILPPLTDAEVRDIAITAAEGGIGYWATIVSDYEAVSGAGWADWETFDENFPFYTIVDNDAYDPFTITPAVIRRGWHLCLAADHDKGGWAAQDIAFDPERILEVDSVAADIIIQFAVFGELIYG